MFGRSRQEIGLACAVLGLIGFGTLHAMGQSNADFWIEEAARRARQVLPSVPAMPAPPRETGAQRVSGWGTGAGSWGNGGSWGTSGRPATRADTFRVLTVPSLRTHERIRPVESAGPSRPRPSNGSHLASAQGGGNGAGAAVCVRMCDGAFFPLASAGSAMGQEQTCSSLCPGAPTRVYYLQNGADKGIEGAVSARTGAPYESLPVAYRFTKTHDQTCSCQSQNFSRGQIANFLNDHTLRSGDSVMTTGGIRVFHGGARFPWRETDFVALASDRELPRGDRQRLVAIERASLRYGPTPVGALDQTASTGGKRLRHGRHRHRHWH